MAARHQVRGGSALAGSPLAAAGPVAIGGKHVPDRSGLSGGLIGVWYWCWWGYNQGRKSWVFPGLQKERDLRARVSWETSEGPIAYPPYLYFAIGKSHRRTAVEPLGGLSF